MVSPTVACCFGGGAACNMCILGLWWADKKLLMCSLLLLSLMDLLLSFALVLFPTTKQRESLTLLCCMGLLWVQDNAKRDGVQMGSAGAFCCRSLPEWFVEHAWMILHRGLITGWFSDHWYPLSFSSSHHQAHFSPTTEQLAAFAAYIYSQLLFSTSLALCCGQAQEWAITVHHHWVVNWCGAWQCTALPLRPGAMHNWWCSWSQRADQPTDSNFSTNMKQG